MMKFWALWMLAAALQAADLRVDHVTVAGRSLSDLEHQLATAGLRFEYGGQHTNGGTEMAVASFSDGSYIELIAKRKNVDAAALANSPWAQFLEGNAGPCAWAVRPKDFGAEVARLKNAGIPLQTSDGGRKRPDGFELQWQTAGLGSAPPGVFLPFLIHDLTPREKRAFPSGKAANREQSGILRVVIGVRKLGDAFDRFRTAYPDAAKPLRQLDKKFGAELAWVPDSPVIFAAPVGNSWIGDRIEKFGEGPVAFVLAGHSSRRVNAWGASRWFGRDIAWFRFDKLSPETPNAETANPETRDAETPGWWLGMEPQ